MSMIEQRLTELQEELWECTTELDNQINVLTELLVDLEEKRHAIRMPIKQEIIRVQKMYRQKLLS